MLIINQELQSGRYRITKQFGQGKTVSFYEAYDKTLGKNILLKKILVSLNQEAQKNDFINEAKFLIEIKHDSFLQVFDYFLDIDSHYLVMELVDGKNVGELIKTGEKPFALADIVDWGEQMLGALDYLHKQTPRIIYFNLKPPNVHLTSPGKIKLLATGIAVRTDATGNITKQAFDSANLNYSPLELIWEKLDSASQRVILNNYDEKSEQILMQPPAVQSDIYSLGATLYHLLTRKIPVDPLERSIEILEGNADPLSAPCEVDANISVEISDVVMKAMEIRRENRFETALEMGEELENAYVQLKERKSRELRNEVPVAPGVPVFKPKPALQKVQNIALESSKNKSEESNQLELIRQKLREAEEQKSVAEKRAVEAEKRLLEKEKQTLSEVEILETTEFHEDSIQLSGLPKGESEIIEEEVWQEEFIEDSDAPQMTSEANIFNANRKNSSSQFQSLFAEPPKDNKIMKKLAIAALGILMLGGGIFGVLRFLPSASTGQNQTVSVSESTNESKPMIEITPEIKTETAPEINEAQTSGVPIEAKQNVSEIPVKPNSVKEKPVVPQIATAKTPTTPKSAVNENQKKKVTVDDLINDTPKKKVTVDDLINDN